MLLLKKSLDLSCGYPCWLLNEGSRSLTRSLLPFLVSTSVTNSPCEVPFHFLFLSLFPSSITNENWTVGNFLFWLLIFKMLDEDYNSNVSILNSLNAIYHIEPMIFQKSMTVSKTLEMLFNFHWPTPWVSLFHWYSIFSSHDALNIIYAFCLLILKHRRRERRPGRSRKILFISSALLKKAFHRKILQDIYVGLVEREGEREKITCQVLFACKLRK